MGDKVTNACQGCTERRLGCHSECERYAIYREHMEAIDAARKREKDADGYFSVKNAKLREASGAYKKKMERR